MANSSLTKCSIFITGIIITLVEIACIIYYIQHCFSVTKDKWIMNIMNVLICFLFIIATIGFTSYALYIRKVCCIIFYLSICIFSSLLRVAYFIFLFFFSSFYVGENINLAKIENTVKFVLYIIISALMLRLRNEINYETEHAMWNAVDDTWTEEMFQNIWRQSKDPDNEKWVQEFNQWSKDKKKNMLFSSILTDDLNKSCDNANKEN